MCIRDRVKESAELITALETAFNEDSKVVVEEAIVGREIEVAVLGNEEPKASCIGEIFAANEFYDYNSKYENQKSRTGVVTDLTPAKEREIRDTAVRVFEKMCIRDRYITGGSTALIWTMMRSRSWQGCQTMRSLRLFIRGLNSAPPE